AGLAAELARGQPDANPARPTRERSPAPDADAEPMRGQPMGRGRIEPRIETKIEPRMEHPGPQPNGSLTAAADQNLAEMAQRLEAALRRPGGAARSKEPRAASVDAPATPVTAAESEMQPETAAPSPPEQRSARAAPATARPVRSEGRPAQPQQKSVYDSLEQ